MAILKPKAFNFARGLETTLLPENTDIPAFQTFQNVRVQKGAAQRRPGMVRIGHVATSAVCGTFDGINGLVTIPTDTRIGTLGLQWTVEILANASVLTGDHYLWGCSSASTGIRIKQTSANTIVAEVKDSTPTLTTLTATGAPVNTLLSIQLKRDGGTVTLTVSNGTSVTGTMSATLLMLPLKVVTIGGDQAANYYNGKIDFVRWFRVARSGQMDGFCRLLNPRAPSVIGDYPMEVDSNNYVLDRSSMGLHAKATGGVTFAAASLALNHAPVQVLAANRTNDQLRKMYAVIQGRVYQVDY